MCLPTYLFIGFLLLKPISLSRPRWSCWASYILSRKSCKYSDAKEPTTDSPSHISLNLIEKRQKTKFQEYVILLLAQGQASHQIGRAMNFPQEKKWRKKKKHGPKPFTEVVVSGVTCKPLLFTPAFLILVLSLVPIDGRFPLTSKHQAQPLPVEPSPAHHPSTLTAPVLP